MQTENRHVPTGSDRTANPSTEDVAARVARFASLQPHGWCNVGDNALLRDRIVMPAVVPLDHADLRTAQRIQALLETARGQEAALLGNAGGMPAARTAEQVRNATAFYLGIEVGAELAGAISIGPDDEPGQIAIDVLAVRPAHQHRGLGRALVAEALRRGVGFVFSVSTTAANLPALALYRGLGFLPYRHGSLDGVPGTMIKLRRERSGPAPEPREQTVAADDL